MLCHWVKSGIIHPATQCNILHDLNLASRPVLRPAQPPLQCVCKTAGTLSYTANPPYVSMIQYLKKAQVQLLYLHRPQKSKCIANNAYL